VRPRLQGDWVSESGRMLSPCDRDAVGRSFVAQFSRLYIFLFIYLFIYREPSSFLSFYFNKRHN
jgi:hypothetical protein